MEEEIFESDSGLETLHQNEISSLIEAKEELTQACHDLTRKLFLANQEKLELLSELEILTQQLKLTKVEQKFPKFETETPTNTENLEGKIEQLKIINFKLEIELQELKLKYKDLETELNAARSKLTSAAETRLEEIILVKEEIMSLRDVADRSAQIINGYEQKIEEITQMQISLEQNNAELHQKNLRLEEDMQQLIKNTTDCLERERALQEENDAENGGSNEPRSPGGTLMQYRRSFDSFGNPMSWIQWKRLTVSSRTNSSC